MKNYKKYYKKHQFLCNILSIQDELCKIIAVQRLAVS